MLNNKFAKALLVGSIALSTANCARMEDKVNADPSWGNAYSGYLTVGDSNSKELHYVFVESKSANQSNDPVLVWFNGGPGCSSLEGFFVENGPIIVDNDTKTITQNPNPWNTAANVLYLESPAGVGYSIADTDADMAHNDLSQSIDAFEALQGFFETYPEYL